MKQKGWGRIINTASRHSLVASPNKSAYVAAKHGVAGFTKTVALEAARDGVTVNCISPGYVWTPLVEKQIPDTMKTRGLTREQVMNDVLLAAQPTKRFVTPEEVAELAVFLCSEEARARSPAPTSAWTAAGRRPRLSAKMRAAPVLLCLLALCRLHARIRRSTEHVRRTAATTGGRSPPRTTETRLRDWRKRLHRGA